MKTLSKAQNERLIQEYKTYSEETLTDHLSLIARDVEDAMTQCGAEPGKDYTHLDIFKLAVQLVNRENGK